MEGSRHALYACGHTFAGRPDIEALLFMEWGAGCLPQLNGMYAFAVRDRRAETLTLAREYEKRGLLPAAHLGSRLAGKRKILYV